MKLALYALLASLLAGCTGLPSAGPSSPRSVTAAPANRGDLLYVSDYASNDVYEYSVPEGKRIGVLTGVLKNFVYPTGLCADGAGNVFIPDSADASVLEFGHGGSHPIARLADPNEYPFSCAVDPVTGDLAVANIESFHGGGSISVYVHAHGPPVTYTYANVYKYYFGAYDSGGNLFVDTTYDAPSAPFVFLELPKGRKTLRIVTLEQAFALPGGVAWDGRDIVVADSKSSTITRFSIRGRIGKKIGSVQLSEARYLAQFVLARSQIVGASFHGRSVGFWEYRSGGPPQRTLRGFGEPFGVTLSRVPR